MMQLNWKLDLFKGMINFYELDKKIGHMPILSLFSKYTLVSFQDEKFHVHTNGIGGNQYRVFNRTNENELASVKINFWSSGAELKIQDEASIFLFSSNFLGIIGAKWNSQHNRIMGFNNRLINGSAETHLNNDSNKVLLFITGLQLINYFSFFFLIMLVVVFIVIL